MAADAKGIRAGKAYVELGTLDKSLTRGLRAASAKLRAFGNGVAAIGLRTMGIGAAIVAPLAAAAKVFSSMGDEIGKMSKRTGLGAEFLSELGYAARLSGASLEDTEKQVTRLQRAAYDAARGSKEQVEAFASLGVSATDASGALRPTEDIFRDVVNSLAGVTNETQKAGLSLVLFGRSGTQILPMIHDGEKGLKAMMAEAHKLGLVMSKEDVQAAEEMTDQFERLWSAAKMGVFRVGRALAPILGDFAAGTARIAATIGDWINKNRELIVLVLKLGVGLIVAGVGMALLGKIIAGVGLALGLLAKGISLSIGLLKLLLSPIALTTIAIGGLTAAVVHFSGNSGRVLSGVGKAFAGLRDDAVLAFNGIRDAMAAGDLQAAATLLWAFLKMTWARGVAALKAIWGGIKDGFAKVILDAWYGAQAGLIEAWGALERWWIGLTTTMEVAWTGMVTKLRSIWESTVGTLAAAFLEEELRSQFQNQADALVRQGILEPGGQRAYVDQKMAETHGDMIRGEKRLLGEAAANVKAIEAEGAKAQAAAERREAARLKESRAMQQATAGVIGEGSLKADTARNAAAAARQAASDKELAEAQKAYRLAVAETAHAVAHRGDEMPDWEKLPDKAAKAAAAAAAAPRTVERTSIGTFNPSMIGRIMGGTFMSDIAASTRETAKYTKAIAEQTRDGATFSD